jgi:signal transduction histidine kinase
VSIFHNLRRESRAYLSKRLWALGALLLMLCALAWVQYHWIDEVAQAERQRAITSLNTSLTDLEADFDIEITRCFAAFRLPAVSPADYAERYRQWLRQAPYPSLIRGVYVLDTSKAGPLLRAVTPGEPAVASTQWERDLPARALSLPFGSVTASASADPATGVTLFSQGGFAGPYRSSGPLMVDGNPAFAFLIMPGIPRAATEAVSRIQRGAPPLGQIEIRTFGGSQPPSQWAVVVLDGNYIKTTLLPKLLRAHFPNGSASDYDFLVVNEAGSAASRIAFHSESARSESQFLHPDGSIRLFALRLDCFLPPGPTGNLEIAGASILQPGRRSESARMVGTPPEVHLLTGIDDLPEILGRKPTSCDNPAPISGGNSRGSWEMLVRYRSGSLDQTMATFRHRSFLISCSVLLVLAVGILMLVLLTERARALAEMQTEFVLGVSHELRTPLTVIRVAADNLKKGLVENSEQAHKYGEIISTQAAQLSDMIEETLAFARMQSATLIGKRTAASPEQIVQASVANCQATLHNAGIKVDLLLASDLPAVEVDVRLINRCLENLIQNVVKYAAAGRSMAIRVNRTDRPDGEWAEISIADRGPGISSVDLPHIFEPFYRGRQAEASQVPGVGLGLTLVKRVVEAHHGMVEVVSSENTGTLFSILLPALPVPPETQKGA